MKKTSKILTALLVVASCFSCYKNIEDDNFKSASTPKKELVIFPQPQEMQPAHGSFRLNSQVGIIAGDGVNSQNVQFLKSYIKLLAGVEIASETEGSTSIHLSLNDDASHNKEGYTLEVCPEEIKIQAQTNAGIFYAIQTLGQLIDGSAIAAVSIKDQPRFAWRGVHLDVSRHFFDKEFVKRFIDLLSLYKFNIFHWHLTDDDGWRIEIKKYPKLTTEGAWRPSVGRRGNQARGLNVDDGKPYGGFYTQEDIREVVAYAKERHIDVLPEIDIPGHSRGITRSYPEYATHAGSDVLNIGKPETISFLEDVFTEVSELFPFEYVHIGCDEVGIGAWKKNADCINKMKELGTTDPHVLHRWLVEHLQSYMAKKNKKVIAWCEVLDCNVDKDTAVMAWRDNGGWIKAPKRGHETVATPSMQTYFNYQEDVNSNAPGHGGYRTTIKKVYNFNPVDKSLTPEQAKLVMGAQGCVWTEFIPNPEHVEFITFPRAVALAEALWTPLELKDWDGFDARIEAHQSFMEKWNINYRVAAPLIKDIRDYKISFVDKVILHLSNPNATGEIRYTKTGSSPDASSTLYNEEVIITDECQFKAAVFLPNGRRSYEASLTCNKVKPTPGTTLTETNLGLLLRSYDSNLNDEFDVVFTTDAKEIISVADFTKLAVFSNKLCTLTGYLNIKTESAYSFEIENTARLYIGSRMVSRKSRPLFLGAGHHPITIICKKDAMGVVQNIKMKNVGGVMQKISPDNLVHTEAQSNLIINLKSSLKPHGHNQLGNLLDEDPDTFFWANTSPKDGDYILIQFSRPATFDSILIQTGLPNGRDKLEAGILEVSEDGKTFRKVADVTGGTASANAVGNLFAIRLKVIRPQNNWLIVRKIVLDK